MTLTDTFSSTFTCSVFLFTMRKQVLKDLPRSSRPLPCPLRTFSRAPSLPSLEPTTVPSVPRRTLSNDSTLQVLSRALPTSLPVWSHAVRGRHRCTVDGNDVHTREHHCGPPCRNPGPLDNGTRPEVIYSGPECPNEKESNTLGT